MSTTKKLPKGLPALPPVPKGYSRWEYMGVGWTDRNNRSPWAFFYAPAYEKWIRRAITRIPSGTRGVHYIVAVRDAKPAKKKAAAKSAKSPAASATALGSYLAREIMKAGGDPRGECTRIQFMIGKPFYPDEVRGGGFCEVALALHISAALSRYPDFAKEAR